MRDMDEGSQLVSRNLEKASELVSSFKQVAMDRTSAQRRKFSLSAILHETRLTLSPAFKRTPYLVNIQIEEDMTMDTYPGPLGQVVTNLLNNALVHAFDGRATGTVVMRAERNTILWNWWWRTTASEFRKKIKIAFSIHFLQPSSVRVAAAWECISYTT